MDILEGSSSEDEGTELKINKSYAKSYEKWRSKEEKQKLIDKYGDVGDGSSSSSEDEEIRTTKQMDKDWLRAYAVVRFQQPRLYKDGEKFFKEAAEPVSKKKEKAMTLKDHERKFILEKGGIEDEEGVPKPQGKSYFEEQEEIKQSFKEAVQDSSSEDEGEGLLVKKKKTKEEQIKEENEYLEWLRGERDDLEDEEAAKELAPLKAYWNDPNLSEKERVLRDYVLNNGYMDEEKSEESSESEGPDVEEDEEFLEKAEEYEHKYNFRHEEPGADEIKSYPRVIEDSVRVKDTRRIEMRQRRMERKRTEKEKRDEEIRLLQKLHREERKEKLRKLQEIANNPKLEYDLEADFDPAEHDKIMQSCFGTDYYGDADAAEKPEFEYDAAIDSDDPDDWFSERVKEEQEEEVEDGEMNEGNEDAGGEEEYYEEEENFNMDADFDPSVGKKSKKERKNKSKKKEAKQKLPLFDPTKKTFDEYIDEYLKDKIGTLPFTYREVVPNDYGLTTEEILTAQEKELNQWVGVKRMSQYKSKQEELADRRKFAMRAQQANKKYKLIPSLLQKPKETKKKKKKKKSEEESSDDSSSESSDESDAVSDTETEKKPGKKQEQKSDSSSPAKKKKKRKNSESESLSESPAKKKKRVSEDASSESSSKKVPSKTKVKKEKSQSLKVKDVSSSVQQKVEKEESVSKKNKEKGKQKGQAEMKVSTNTGNNAQGVKNKKKKKNSEVADTKSRPQTNKQSVKPEQKKKKKKQPEAIATSNEKSVQQKEKSANSNGIDASKNPSVEDKLLAALESSDKTAGGLSNSKKMGQMKKKKKKLSVNIYGKGSKPEASVMGPKGDKKKLQKTLSQMMSASRLGKYGIGPKAQKGKKKKKKMKPQS